MICQFNFLVYSVLTIILLFFLTNLTPYLVKYTNETVPKYLLNPIYNSSNVFFLIFLVLDQFTCTLHEFKLKVHTTFEE